MAEAVTGSYWAYANDPKTGQVSKWFWRCDSDDDEMGVVKSEEQAQRALYTHLATHPENETSGILDGVRDMIDSD